MGLFSMVATTVKQEISSLLRVPRCTDDGDLIISGGGSAFDVNVAEVNGNTTLEGGVNGSLAVGGTQAAETAADDGAFPVKIGGVVRNVLTALDVGDRAQALFDSFGRLWVRTAGYDTDEDAIKTYVTNGIQTDRDESAQNLANVTNVAVATNYPSNAGKAVGDRPFLTFMIQMRDGSFDIQVSEDQTVWSNVVTKQLVDNEDGENGFDNTHYNEPDVATEEFAVEWQGCGHLYYRLVFTPGDATNVFIADVVARATM